MAIKHSFVSTKQEKSDTSLVRKTEWNADHVIDITTADVPDSADKRYCTDAQKTVIGNTSGTNSGDSATPAETATTIGALIGVAGDATPNDTDFVATSLTTGGILKKITWTNVKAFLKTYFDTLYNKYVHPNHSGDVTSVADGAQTIANSAVTYAKIQNVSATDKVLGRSTAGAGAVEEIACTAAGRALIDDADAATQRATLGLGTIATQASNSVAITGGTVTGITGVGIGTVSNVDTILNVGGTLSTATARARAIDVVSTINAVAGLPAYGVAIRPTLVLASSGTHDLFANLAVRSWNITGSGAVLTDAASLWIESTPSGATNNYYQLVGSNVFAIKSDGNVGIGVTTFGTSAAKVLGIATGTAPSDSPADMIQIYSEDISAGNCALSIYQEAAPYAGAAVASTHKIPVRWNGTTYYLLATTVA